MRSFIPSSYGLKMKFKLAWITMLTWVIYMSNLCCLFYFSFGSVHTVAHVSYLIIFPVDVRILGLSSLFFVIVPSLVFFSSELMIKCDNLFF